MRLLLGCNFPYHSLTKDKFSTDNSSENEKLKNWVIMIQKDFPDINPTLIQIIIKKMLTKSEGAFSNTINKFDQLVDIIIFIVNHTEAQSSTEITFEEFCALPHSQLCSNKIRVTNWINLLLSNIQSDEQSLTVRSVNVENNCTTNVLLKNFDPKEKTQEPFYHNFHDFSKEIFEKTLSLQKELPCRDVKIIDLLDTGLEHLLNIVYLYDQPLKILFLIPPQRLFSLFSHIPKVLVTHPGFKQLISHLTATYDILNTREEFSAHLSIIKWCLTYSNFPSDRYDKEDMLRLTLSDVESILVKNQYYLSSLDTLPYDIVNLIFQLELTGNESTNPFANQTDLQQFILQLHISPKYMILESAKLPIDDKQLLSQALGSALIDFLINTRTESDDKLLRNAPLFSGLKQFFIDVNNIYHSDDSFYKNFSPSCSSKQQFLHSAFWLNFIRLSNKAHGVLLSKVSTEAQILPYILLLNELCGLKKNFNFWEVLGYVKDYCNLIYTLISKIFHERDDKKNIHDCITENGCSVGDRNTFQITLESMQNGDITVFFRGKRKVSCPVDSIEQFKEMISKHFNDSLEENHFFKLLKILDRKSFASLLEYLLTNKQENCTTGKLIVFCWTQVQHVEIDRFLANAKNPAYQQFLLKLVDDERIKFSDIVESNPLSLYLSRKDKLDVFTKVYYGKIFQSPINFDVVQISPSSMCYFMVAPNHTSRIEKIKTEHCPNGGCALNLLETASTSRIRDNLVYFRNLLLERNGSYDDTYLIALYLYFLSFGFTESSLSKLLDQSITEVIHSIDMDQYNKSERCFFPLTINYNISKRSNILYGKNSEHNWRLANILLSSDPADSPLTGEEKFEDILEKLGTKIAKKIKQIANNSAVLSIGNTFTVQKLSSVLKYILPLGQYLLQILLHDDYDYQENPNSKPSITAGYLSIFIKCALKKTKTPIQQAILHHSICLLFAYHIQPYPYYLFKYVFEFFISEGKYVSANIMQYTLNIDKFPGNNYADCPAQAFALEKQAIWKPLSILINSTDYQKFVLNDVVTQLITTKANITGRKDHNHKKQLSTKEPSKSLFIQSDLAGHISENLDSTTSFSANSFLKKSKKLIDASILTTLNTSKDNHHDFLIVSAVNGGGVCLSRYKESKTNRDYDKVWKVHTPEESRHYSNTEYFTSFAECLNYCLQSGAAVIANGMIINKSTSSESYRSHFLLDHESRSGLPFFQILPCNELLSIVEASNIIELLEMINKFLLAAVKDSLKPKEKDVNLTFPIFHFLLLYFSLMQFFFFSFPLFSFQRNLKGWNKKEFMFNSMSTFIKMR